MKSVGFNNYVLPGRYVIISKNKTQPDECKDKSIWNQTNSTSICLCHNEFSRSSGFSSNYCKTCVNAVENVIVVELLTRLGVESDHQCWWQYWSVHGFLSDNDCRVPLSSRTHADLLLSAKRSEAKG